jgi:hypothetical protein
MAEVTKKEKADIVRTLIDAYAIGVRGGVLTPSLADENAFRKMMGLESASEPVVAEWQRTKGVRLPITLQRGISEPEGDEPEQEGESDE